MSPVADAIVLWALGAFVAGFAAWLVWLAWFVVRRGK